MLILNVVGVILGFITSCLLIVENLQLKKIIKHDEDIQREMKNNGLYKD